MLWLLFSYIFSSASTLSQEQDSTLGLTEPFQMQCGCSLATTRSLEVHFSTLHALLQAVPLGFDRPNQSKLHKIWSNVQGPRYTNASIYTDPKLNITQLKKAKKPTGLSIVQCRANMGDGEHARICPLVPDVATSAWGPGVKFRPQNYSLLASPLCTLFYLTNC